MSSPSKIPLTEPISILSLHQDLLLNCLARVSRLDYPTLSLVCKHFRSTIASSEIYKTRQLLNRTEKCLYFCFQFPSEPNPLWFTLCRNPNRTVANKSSGYVMVQIQSPNKHLHPMKWSDLVAVGSNIYKFGGSDDPLNNERKRNVPWRSSSSVSVLDCRSHTWHDAPSMGMMRDLSASSSLVDGKIYVAGGCDLNSSNRIEVFDPKTQTWGYVTSPRISVKETHNEFCVKRVLVETLGLEGKLYLFGNGEFVVYNPKEDSWSPIGMEEDSDISCAINNRHCVVDDVLFYWEKGVFKWYDSKVRSWKELLGVVGLPAFKWCEMVDLGGKMAVWWEDTSPNGEEGQIWCAEIALERRHGDEIWGYVEWFDLMLTVEATCRYALSVSV
ncbi:hypothetical protein AALP_AA4G267000 [Arabis alpina]|uniref:F-box domain-containing protein n=1 Tax=Arabis alpina TaxID=50452 RepID=A0A087H5W1_ARAAL|nr:hypothetical protein AALP_AA4G267000 [Arabis alpina]